MKVLLLSPREAERSLRFRFLHRVYRRLERVVKFTWDDIEFSPNLGLLTVAAFLPPDWEAEYVDEDYLADPRAYERMHERDCDLVLMTAVTTQVERAFALADRFRARGIHTCLGGWHASTMPEECAPHFDTLFLGEGEDTFPAFLDDFRRGRAKARYVSAGNFDLAKSPPPRYDLLEDLSIFNEIPLNVTRGCPYRCSFCTVIDVYGRRYRHKSIDQVHAEIAMIKARLPRPRIIFADENMFVNRRFSRDLLRSFSGAGFTYEAFADVSIADDEGFLDLLAASGCHTVFCGLESTREANLDAVSPFKRSRARDYREAVRRIQERGIKVIGSFIVGLDGDDPEVFREIRDFGLETNLYETGILVLSPVPGTEIWKELKAAGRLLPGYTNQLALEFINYIPKAMTPREIEKGMIRVHKELNTPAAAAARRRYFKGVLARLAERRGPAA